ncbi:c-type cytochrome [Granulicella tundricola]|uniref:Cytochrome c class I n=1 Tax=Granulicella tundricola (strain ATCC BAA-1859 / DSM 23138 / MP5ACTX9) TaxID=1198114 RepID=E8X6B0_GRATM|nr:cytochrome c [Granulicella tundricola]ADW70994.1 cytochrome c class I [Granulicella tundricola MP5ACTX9]
MLTPFKSILNVCLALTSVFAARLLVSSATVHADSTSVRRGAELFAENGCAHCHGTNGIGGGKGPDLNNVAHHMKPKEIATQIHDGGKNMPPYGDALSDQQVADLIDYLHSKRR